MIFGLPENDFLEKGHNSCYGCGEALGMRIALKAATKDTILVQATSCGEVTTTAYPHTAFKLPYIHVLFENAAAVAAGIKEAMEKLGKKTRILVFAGDGGTFDIGFQALSGAIERGHDFCYVCFDTNAYSNTGIQRSGATPKYADTTTAPYGKKIHGKMEYKKPMPMIIAQHKPRYVANASVGDVIDLYNKVKKGLELKGPAYVQVLSPCVVGWKYNSALTVEVGRKAIQTNICPLYEIEDGVLKVRENEKALKVDDYLKLQPRFKHLTKEEIMDIQEHVDREYKYLLSMNNKRVFA